MILSAKSAARSQDRTKIKILIGPTMRCDAAGCDRKAAYLFRTGNGPILAYCNHHANESAGRLGARLPESAEKVLRMATV